MMSTEKRALKQKATWILIHLMTRFLLQNPRGGPVLLLDTGKKPEAHPGGGGARSTRLGKKISSSAAREGGNEGLNVFFFLG